MSGTNDDFEDDDLEPVWASPDDAEDDWDDSFEGDDDFDDGDDFAAESDDDFGDDGLDDEGGLAADDPFDDDEYGDEFGDDDADEFAAADDDFDDEFESSYDDDEEGGDDYGDEDDFDDEGVDEEGAAGGDDRSFIQKQMPNLMIGGFVLFIGYFAYSFILGGGSEPPPPRQTLPPVTGQTAQNQNAPDPSGPSQVANNAPQTAPDPLTPGIPNALPGDLGSIGQLTPPIGDPVTTGQGGIGDLANSVPGLDSIPAPDLSQIPPSDLGLPQPATGGIPTDLGGLPQPATGGLPSGGVPIDLGGLPQPATGGLPSGGVDIASLGQPAAPAAGPAPVPQPVDLGATPSLPPPTSTGAGLSPSLGLSTEPLPEPVQAPTPVAAPAVDTGIQLPTSLAGGVSQADLDQITSNLRGDLRQEIQSGMTALRGELRTTVESVFEEERVLLEAKINGLERQMDMLREQQEALSAAGPVMAAAPTPVAAEAPSEPMMAEAASEPSETMAAESETMEVAAADPVADLEARMNEALGVSEGGETAMATEATMEAPTMSEATAAPTPVVAAPQADRPPVIRRSAAPKSPPPVPAQKPGRFLAQGPLTQPGPFGARLPVQVAQAQLPQPSGAYQLRGVAAGTAWVSAQDSGTVLTVNRGDFLPGLGRVTEIRRSFNGWEVVTERGIIRQ